MYLVGNASFLQQGPWTCSMVAKALAYPSPAWSVAQCFLLSLSCTK